MGREDSRLSWTDFESGRIGGEPKQVRVHRRRERTCGDEANEETHDERQTGELKPDVHFGTKRCELGVLNNVFDLQKLLVEASHRIWRASGETFEGPTTNIASGAISDERKQGEIERWTFLRDQTRRTVAYTSQRGSGTDMLYHE